MNYKETAIKILTECSRLLIGVVFIFSGFVKAVDPMGGAIKIGDYLTSFGLDFLQPFTVLASFALSANSRWVFVCCSAYTAAIILFWFYFSWRL